MMKVSLGGGYKTLNKEKIKRIVQEMDKVQERKRECSAKDTYITKITKGFGVRFP